MQYALWHLDPDHEIILLTLTIDAILQPELLEFILRHLLTPKTPYLSLERRYLLKYMLLNLCCFFFSSLFHIENTAFLSSLIRLYRGVRRCYSFYAFVKLDGREL